MRKITVNLPADLVESVTGLSGKGITETIKDALEADIRRRAYEAFLDLRGKVTFDATWQTLRGKDEPEKPW